MIIDIIVVYIPRYRRGHEIDFVPPITGIHLAALTPSQHQVRVIHQQVDPIPYDTDADLIALAFFSGFAPEAYRLAQFFKSRGKIVVAGGPHVTFWSQEALGYVDAVVIGEAESVWKDLLEDAARGQLKSRYNGEALPLDGLPMPRYDLLSNGFVIRKVVQATRGCPYFCSFCTVPSLNPGFRMRPVDEVLRDIRHDDFPFWWQRKVVWFWDDNLTIRRSYIKDLLRAMIPLKKWWLTQASIDIIKDPELLDLMEASGCIGVFLGIESFGEASLHDANKRQNKADLYRQAVRTLHDHGISVMAGFIAGFDHDSPASIIAMAEQLADIEVDVPFISVLTPFKGTTLYNQLETSGRILDDRGWQFYNGYNVAFQPKTMTEDQLLEAHRILWRKAFRPWVVLKRILRAGFRLRFGAFLLSLVMNGFYGWKAVRKNEPIDIRLRQFPVKAGPHDVRPDSGVVVSSFASAGHPIEGIPFNHHALIDGGRSS